MQMRMRAALTALCEQMPPAGNSQAQVGSVVLFLLVGPDGECGLVAGAERMPLVQVPSSAQPSPTMQLLRRRALRTDRAVDETLGGGGSIPQLWSAIRQGANG